ncbi:unnamed protein product [Tuber aestivum]|uniref:Uncharacterized protein n=1 Tax=Tuber aestivum TaxID=59557 RepID=A0A292Q8G1_9PEZI|nr:unnamed protein product [Tuber aestivum]
MQNSDDDNDWGDLLPSLEETLKLLPELRETAEALGNLRTDPNHNDPKSCGHSGPPTSRSIEPVRTPPYNPPFPNEPARRGRRSKPDLRGLYTPRHRRNTHVASGENKQLSLPTTLNSNRVLPKKGSYRAVMAEAKLFVAEKEAQLQFTPANEHKKLYGLGRGEVGDPAEPNPAQDTKKKSKINSFPIAKRSQPSNAAKIAQKKHEHRYMGLTPYLSTSDSSESTDDAKKTSYRAKLFGLRKGSSRSRKTTAERSASPRSSHGGTQYHTRASPLVTSEVTNKSFRPRRRAAVVAMERARSQFDDPFPGFFAPRRVNRRTAEQNALIPKFAQKEPAIKMDGSASEDDEVSSVPVPVNSMCRGTQLFYKMENIDPEE